MAPMGTSQVGLYQTWTEVDALEPCKEVRIHCASEYLEHVRSLGVRIEALRDEIEHQRALLGPLSARVAERVSGTRRTDRFEEGAIRLDELIREYCTDLVGYVEEYRKAHEVIASLPSGAQVAILTGYYLQGKAWKQVAIDLAYSEGSVYNIRREAMAALWEALPVEWKRLPEAVCGRAPSAPHLGTDMMEKGPQNRSRGFSWGKGRGQPPPPGQKALPAA